MDFISDIIGFLKELIVLKNVVAVCALIAFYRTLQKLSLELLSTKSEDISKAVVNLRSATDKVHATKTSQDANGNVTTVASNSSIDPEQALNQVIKYRVITTVMLLLTAVVFLIVAAVLALK